MYAQEVTLQNSHKLTSSMSDLLYLLSSLVMMYNFVERQEEVRLWNFISPQDKRIPLLQLLSFPGGHSPPYGWSPGGFKSWKTLWTAGSLMTRQHFLTTFFHSSFLSLPLCQSATDCPQWNQVSTQERPLKCEMAMLD